MITILGAGGAIGSELARILAAENKRFRLVGRTPEPVPGAELFIADLTDLKSTIRAVEGSKLVHLLVGLPYDIKLWRESWPKIMENTIAACKRARARLVFFDNVYMYGRVKGPMTEDTPYHPSSRKGEVRAAIATRLMEEVKAGNLTAMIARAADFYGPKVKTGLPNLLVFEPLAKGKKAMWLANARLPHSFTFTPDAARGLMMLTGREEAWNQIWHLPTAPDPPTGRAFVAMAAEALGVEPRYKVLNRLMVKLGGLFDPNVREVYEMLYQNDAPYLFDSSKFARAFGFSGTPYEEGIRLAAESYKRKT
jgi:nucleoside-diphosphate-sugar epimerase